jgi:Gram-negative bacterial TonB protein C-terminal
MSTRRAIRRCIFSASILFTLLPSLAANAQTPASDASAPGANTSADKSPRPACTNPVKIVYPPLARRNDVIGDLEVQATIGKDGNVRDIKILHRKLNKNAIIDRDGNSQDVTNIFDDEAIRVAKSFRCPQLDASGNPRELTFLMPLSFRLN